MKNIVMIDEGHDQEFSKLVAKLLEDHESVAFCNSWANVGTIGHIDHGKTPLTVAILSTLSSKVPCPEYSDHLYSYSECLGAFDKKVVGKHRYPHWHKQKY